MSYGRKQYKTPAARLSVTAWNDEDVEPHRFFDVGAGELQHILETYTHVDVTSWGVFAKDGSRGKSAEAEKIHALLANPW